MKYSKRIDYEQFLRGKETIIKLKKDFWCKLDDKRKIIVPKGFESDGASIPKAFWSLVGHPLQTDNLKPALIHDFQCRLGQNMRGMGLKYEYIWQEVHNIFKEGLISMGVPKWRANIMHNAVYGNWLLHKSLRW